MTNLYRVYIKETNSKRFKALNYEEGCLADNLLYASVFTEEQATRLVTRYNELYPSIQIEKRIVKG